MRGPASSSSAAPQIRVARSPEAARVLVDPAERRFLEPFIGRELTTSEAARLLGESVEKTAYRVRSLLAKELLAPVREVPRKGRAMTVYTAGEEIHSELALLPAVDVQHLFDALDQGGRTAFLRSLSALASRRGLFDWTFRLHRNEDGQVLFDMASPEISTTEGLQAPDAPSITFNWVPVAMGDAAAKELQRELAALVARLPVETGRPTHLVGLFLTPLAPE